MCTIVLFSYAYNWLTLQGVYRQACLYDQACFNRSKTASMRIASKLAQIVMSELVIIHVAGELLIGQPALKGLQLTATTAV